MPRPDPTRWDRSLPAGLQDAVNATAAKLGVTAYFAGGEVRDWLLGRESDDLDITVTGSGLAFARALARALQATFVPLSPADDLGRVAGPDLQVDVSGLRAGSRTIEDDLRQRDFTVNAMAVPVGDCREGALIDPENGRKDLQQGRLRLVAADALAADPLRVLRGWRFMAQLDLTPDAPTRAAMLAEAPAMTRCAGERQRVELDKLMATARAAAVIGAMAECGTLWVLFPELEAGVGMAQPASHHLDVFGHSLEALRRMEEIIAAPKRRFRDHETISTYLAPPRVPILLKYAALFHDLGKPATLAERNGRLTYYNHDQTGAKLFGAIAGRLVWSRRDRDRVALLIREHMRPFHLNNARKKQGITPRACLRLAKAAGDDISGLFLLAMADSLAGMGPGKPAGMEDDMDQLFTEVMTVYRERVAPVLTTRPLVNGRELQEIFALAPGPVIGRLLAALQHMQVEDPDLDRETAITRLGEQLPAITHPDHRQ